MLREKLIIQLKKFYSITKSLSCINKKDMLCLTTLRAFNIQFNLLAKIHSKE